MPEPEGSLPVQATLMLVEVVVAGRGVMALVSEDESSVLVTVLVAMAALTSKTMLAWLVMAVPSARPVLGLTVKVTEPEPAFAELFGGRKPAVGFAGMEPVTGSTDCMVTLSTPVAGLTEAETFTGFESVETLACVEYVVTPVGTLSETLLKEMLLNWRVDQSRVFASGSVTVTITAGAVAVGWFSK